MKKFWKENGFLIKQIGLYIICAIAFFVFVWGASQFFELLDKMFEFDC